MLPGQPPQPGMGGPQPGMAPPMGGPPTMAPAMGGLFSSIASLAQNMPRTAMEKVREAMKLLEEAHEEDSKLGHLPMAMSIITHGPDSIEKFGFGESSGPTSRPTTSEGVE